MNKFYHTLCLLTISVMCCSSTHSQTVDRISQISEYCDNLDKLNVIQTVHKVGAGVTLEYIISNGNVVKIIERPSGYKFISGKETYYIQNNNIVYVNADIEISNENIDTLTIELHKIYFDSRRIIKHLISETTFSGDSLYNANSDPTKTADDIRKNAKFKPKRVDKEFERTLLQTIDNYLNARTKKDGDPILDKLYSPFI